MFYNNILKLCQWVSGVPRGVIIIVCNYSLFLWFIFEYILKWISVLKWRKKILAAKRYVLILVYINYTDHILWINLIFLLLIKIFFELFMLFYLNRSKFYGNSNFFISYFIIYKNGISITKWSSSVGIRRFVPVFVLLKLLNWQQANLVATREYLFLTFLEALIRYIWHTLDFFENEYAYN